MASLRQRVSAATARSTDEHAFMREAAHEFFARFPHQNRLYFVEGLALAAPDLRELYHGSPRLTQKVFEAGVEIMRKHTGKRPLASRQFLASDDYRLADTLLAEL